MSKKSLLLVGCAGFVLVAGACLFLALVLGLVATDDAPANKIGDSARPDTPAEPQPPTTFKVGDIIETKEWGDHWTIVVRGVSYPSGEGWYPSQEGNKFVLIDLEVVNTSEDPQTLSSIISYSMKDSADREYDTSYASGAQGNAPEGDFVAGEKKVGPVVFQVPGDAAGFVFVFEPSTFGSQRVFVELQ